MAPIYVDASQETVLQGVVVGVYRKYN